jgi:GNAT superfamily N-acetyltransferase
VTFHIRPFQPADAPGVASLIVPIQREEFGVAVTLADQPDLADIPGFYRRADGNFWVAEADGRIVGTTGLLDIGDGLGALRKMFVAADFRGRAHGVSGRLLGTLFDWASARKFAKIYLGTTDRFLAAHRFYEKSGFVEIAKRDLPASFPIMAVDTKFYVRACPPAEQVEKA